MNLDVNNIIVSSNYRGVDNEVSRIFDSSGVLPEKMGRRGISSPVLSYLGRAILCIIIMKWKAMLHTNMTYTNTHVL